MHAKLTVVLLAMGYHHACGTLLRKFEAHTNQRGHVWSSTGSVEVPVVLLLIAVILVVVKPFSILTAVVMAKNLWRGLCRKCAWP
jgi:putative membrane protein